MLTSDHQVRLTPDERRRVQMLTGTDPVHITTRAGLVRFVREHGARARRHGGPGACLAQRLLEALL